MGSLNQAVDDVKLVAIDVLHELFSFNKHAGAAVQSINEQVASLSGMNAAVPSVPTAACVLVYLVCAFAALRGISNRFNNRFICRAIEINCRLIFPLVVLRCVYLPINWVMYQFFTRFIPEEAQRISAMSISSTIITVLVVGTAVRMRNKAVFSKYGVYLPRPLRFLKQIRFVRTGNPTNFNRETSLQMIVRGSVNIIKTSARSVIQLIKVCVRAKIRADKATIRASIRLIKVAAQQIIRLVKLIIRLQITIVLFPKTIYVAISRLRRRRAVKAT